MFYWFPSHGVLCCLLIFFQYNCKHHNILFFCFQNLKKKWQIEVTAAVACIPIFLFWYMETLRTNDSLWTVEMANDENVSSHYQLWGENEQHFLNHEAMKAEGVCGFGLRALFQVLLTNAHPKAKFLCQRTLHFV